MTSPSVAAALHDSTGDGVLRINPADRVLGDGMDIHDNGQRGVRIRQPGGAERDSLIQRQLRVW